MERIWFGTLEPAGRPENSGVQIQKCRFQRNIIIEFSSPDEMRRMFPSLYNFKFKDKWWVIDVAGNHLRVIAFIQFVHKRMYVMYILTHADYDRLCKRCARGDLK